MRLELHAPPGPCQVSYARPHRVLGSPRLEGRHIPGEMLSCPVCTPPGSQHASVIGFPGEPCGGKHIYEKVSFRGLAGRMDITEKLLPEAGFTETP